MSIQNTSDLILPLVKAHITLEAPLEAPLLEAPFYRRLGSWRPLSTGGPPTTTRGSFLTTRGPLPLLEAPTSEASSVNPVSDDYAVLVFVRLEIASG